MPSAIGIMVPVLSVEDVVIDRLRQVVHWGAEQPAVQALVLLSVNRHLDRDRLDARARGEGLSGLLQDLGSLADHPLDVDESTIGALVARHARLP